MRPTRASKHTHDIKPKKEEDDTSAPNTSAAPKKKPPAPKAAKKQSGVRLSAPATGLLKKPKAPKYKPQQKQGKRVPRKASSSHPDYVVKDEWATVKKHIKETVGHEHVRNAASDKIYTTIYYVIGEDDEVRRARPSNVERYKSADFKSYTDNNKQTEPKEEDIKNLRSFKDDNFDEIADGVGYFRAGKMGAFEA
ncbi:hypothetical protein JCM10213_006671 [Rhodosporidiobolus nylandii]